ncbi:hypothetical protein [Hydrogenophaga sp.]|uniref:hypothetical protein n=1 Tax=Hydrogenophaga sp. TaxID=1904254 RepID=UPI00271C8415|nr:hypothetical protein [Hydrogenophaga sp.]MDO9131968.1 hypothetical protein [Hydrogenophaga sp.]
MKKRIASVMSMPAPVAGWNAREPIAQMGPRDAVILDNFFPLTTEVSLRSGSTDHVTGITGTVETLMDYSTQTGANTIFAAAGSAFYNVTTPGAVGAAVQTGLSNAQWRYVNFSTAGGSFLYAVNGADDPRLWNGTAWTAINGASTPAITGVTTNTLTHINVYARRIWFTQKDTMKVWYLPVDSIGGAAQSIDFASLFNRGGFLMAMGTWTIDSGSGMDDHAVFFTSEGQVAVYQGIDPSTAAGFVLVGVYDIGEPVTRNCFVKYGSDLLLICRDGVQPLSAALQSSRVSTKVSITDKIQQAMSDATGTYAASYGWQLQVFPEKNALILNVPVIGGQQQFVMNTLSGAWCRFLGWNASCFVQSQSRLYFGTNGKVCEAWTGANDSGVAITGNALASFQYHGGMTQKRYTMVRPIITTDSPNVGVLLRLNVDFDIQEPVGSPTFSPSTAATWDVSTWDTGIWSGGFSLRKDWNTIGGIGYCAALYLKVQTNSAQLRWQSVDYVAEAGSGVL